MSVVSQAKIAMHRLSHSAAASYMLDGMHGGEMGQHKQEMNDAARSWQEAARINGYRCSVCGEIPPHEEREVYFETNLCGYHAYQAQKDD